VSGLLRNLIAFVIGLFAYGSKAVEDATEVKFLVTPFDGGVRVLKSDKYLQFAETAQVDYLLKTGKLFSSSSWRKLYQRRATREVCSPSFNFLPRSSRDSVDLRR